MQESALMISHTSTERKLAEAWKALLRDVFGLADESVWFSSDPGAIDATGPFANTIEKEIGDAQAILSIQSPVSRFRPWILWEAGMARALGKPVYVIVYERSDATRDERIYGKLGTPLDPFEQFPGTDLTRVQGVIELLQAHISRPLKPGKLNEALRDYEKGVKALENYWVLRKQIFEKRIQLCRSSRRSAPTNKSSVSNQVISLPKGGGALHDYHKREDTFFDAVYAADIARSVGAAAWVVATGHFDHWPRLDSPCGASQL